MAVTSNSKGMARSKKLIRRNKLQRNAAPESGNKGRFDQLLDDAILGVKKKNPRG